MGTSLRPLQGQICLRVPGLLPTLGQVQGGSKQAPWGVWRAPCVAMLEFVAHVHGDMCTHSTGSILQLGKLRLDR